MAEATVQVFFTANTQKYRQAVGDVESSNSKMSDGFKKVGAVIAGAFAADKLLDFGRSALSQANDLNETLSKSNTIFGDNAKEIEQWASGAAKGFGQSKRQALGAAGTFGNMFTQLGIGTDKAAGMSKQMTELASDFASFHNAAPVDVLEAMTAAFRGEYDAVQRYVPTINAAAVEQKALQMGLAGSTKELTAQHKALATQALLMEGAGAAMGDFDRTSDQLANRQRILSARWEDMQAALGQKLLPIATRFSGWMLNDAIPAIEATSRWMNDNLVPAIETGFEVIRTVIEAAVGWWNDHWETIRSTTETVIGVIQGIIETVFGAIEAFWRTWGGTITRYFQDLWEAIRQIIDGALTIIRGIIQTVMALIHGDFSGAWDGIKQIFSGVWEYLNGLVDVAINSIRTTIEVGMRLIAGVFDATWDAITGAAGRAWDSLTGGASNAVAAIKGVFTDLAANLVGIVGDITSRLFGFVVDLWDVAGRVIDTFAGIGDGIKEAFRAAFNFIADAWNSTVGKLSFKVPGWVPGLGGKGWDVPDIPHFDMGGIVPGPIGAPQLILAHGGETVLPTHRGGGATGGVNLTLQFYGSVNRGMVDYASAQLMKAAAQVGRRIAIDARGVR